MVSISFFIKVEGKVCNGKRKETFLQRYYYRADASTLPLRYNWFGCFWQQKVIFCVWMGKLCKTFRFLLHLASSSARLLTTSTMFMLSTVTEWRPPVTSSRWNFSIRSAEGKVTSFFLWMPEEEFSVGIITGNTLSIHSALQKWCCPLKALLFYYNGPRLTAVGI